MHIGLIGGIGPAATVVYYERIVDAFARENQALHLTIAHTSAAMLARNATENNVDEQVREYCRVTEQLAAAGADAVAITSMGGHFCVDAFEKLAPLPLTSGPESIAAHLQQQGIKRIGILGTRVVMRTRLYGALASLDPVVPDDPELEQVNADYIAMAVAGRATPDQRERLLLAGRQLHEQQAAEAVLLGGTDLNLVYDGADLSFPVIDSAIVHADAIVRAALKR